MGKRGGSMSAAVMTELPQLKDQGCTQCGKKQFLLAVDYTDFESYQFESGKWAYASASSEVSSADKAVRFYCTGCGTDHQVPEGVDV